MPMSRKWVDKEAAQLSGEDRELAKLILIVAMASYQFDDSLVIPALRDDQERLIRVLAFAAMSAARRLAHLAGQLLNVEFDSTRQAEPMHYAEASAT